jgi:hypothetical protein
MAFLVKAFLSKSPKVTSLPGASNLRPRNIFVRPKLDSEFKEKSVFRPIFLRFLIDCGPNYEKKACEKKDQLGLDAPALYSSKWKPKVLMKSIR